jgi:hypothetical protein
LDPCAVNKRKNVFNMLVNSRIFVNRQQLLLKLSDNSEQQIRIEKKRKGDASEYCGKLAGLEKQLNAASAG